MRKKIFLTKLGQRSFFQIAESWPAAQREDWFWILCGGWAGWGLVMAVKRRQIWGLADSSLGFSELLPKGFPGKGVNGPAAGIFQSRWLPGSQGVAPQGSCSCWQGGPTVLCHPSILKPQLIFWSFWYFLMICFRHHFWGLCWLSTPSVNGFRVLDLERFL